MQQRLRFSLRALLILVTLLCVYAAYRTSWTGHDRFASGTTFELPDRDSESVASEVCGKIQSLPRHELSAEPLFALQRRFNAAAYDDVQKAAHVDSFFFRVKLNDGSETLVGFWVYPHPRGRPATVVTRVILGEESFHSIQAGVAAKREKERLDLDRKTYRQILHRMFLDREMRGEPLSNAVARETP